MTREQKIAATIAGTGDLVIALTHEPDSFPDIPSRVALTLAGHTIEGGRHLFVTSGIGTSILPVRFGVTPEIALLTLVAAP